MYLLPHINKLPKVKVYFREFLFNGLIKKTEQWLSMPVLFLIYETIEKIIFSF